jgi:hypothetical protein
MCIAGKGKARASIAATAAGATTSSDENTDGDDINDDEPDAIINGRLTRAAKTNKSPG